ncbi:MAG: prenyltransferase, partial [Candidatus Thorarchaeota archaeon]
PNKQSDSNAVIQDNLPSIKNIGMLKSWGIVLNTCNFPKGMERPDFVSKWLVIFRACVFSMTLFSGIIGGLLAVLTVVATPGSYSLNWVNFFLATLAIIICHAINNMMNDFFDLKGGIDNSEYARAMYAPHPILSGLISKKGLISAILILNALFALITLYFVYQGLFLAVGFAILGFFISYAYVAPPFNFKRHGLGELSVFIIWGPLMTGVVYYVSIGTITPEILLATVPYAITVTTVLFGKHIDKLDADKVKKIYTLPVILGNKIGKIVTSLLMVSFYPLVLLLVWDKVFGIGVLISLLALPRLYTVLKIYSKPKPITPPEDWPVWPLWFVSWAFYHNKLVGGLFILGLFLNIFIPTNFLYIQSILGM